MNYQRLVDFLEQFSQTLVATVDGITEDEAKWKPRSGNWSILEVVCHLIDEERDDFGVRLQLTVEQPGVKWPSWDPEGAVTARDYNSRNLGEMVKEFVEVRTKSVAWLRQLGEVDWSQKYEQLQTLPYLEAGSLLGSWVAHDQLHMRQIAKRKYELIQMYSKPFEVGYAGPWQESQ